MAGLNSNAPPPAASAVEAALVHSLARLLIDDAELVGDKNDFAHHQSPHRRCAEIVEFNPMLFEHERLGCEQEQKRQKEENCRGYNLPNLPDQ